MRIARLSRGYDPRWLWQARAVAPRRARCSSGPTSGASGSTSRWSSRGYTGAFPVLRPPTRRPRRLGGGARCAPATPWLVAVAAPGGEHESVRRRSSARRRASPIPTAARPCAGVDLAVGRASGSPCSARTARARRRSCCTSTASCGRPPATVDGRRPAGGEAQPAPRSAGGSASSSRIPTTSCSCRPCATTWPSGPPTSAVPGPSSTPGRARPSTPSGWRARRPGAAPPQLRSAPAGRGGHRARHAARRPRARRAVVEPRPGGPPGAGGHRRWRSG